MTNLRKIPALIRDNPRTFAVVYAMAFAAAILVGGNLRTLAPAAWGAIATDWYYIFHAAVVAWHIVARG